MRTRSQPASPGGLVALEDMKRATRRTRSTRSTSRGASQEPGAEQTSEQAPEPATQPATRSRSQRTVKKNTSGQTTSITSATSATSTTSTTTVKTQTRKAPKRGTRKTTRKAGKIASDEPQESIGEKYLDSAAADNEENAEFGNEEPVSGSFALDSVLMEPKNTERKSSITLSPSPHPSPSHPPSPVPLSPWLSPTISSPPSVPAGPKDVEELRFQDLIAESEQLCQEQLAESEQRLRDLIANDETDTWEAFLSLSLSDNDLCNKLSESGAATAPTCWDLSQGEPDQISSTFGEPLVSEPPLPTDLDSATVELDLAESVLKEIDIVLAKYEALKLREGSGQEQATSSPSSSPSTSAARTEDQATFEDSDLDELIESFAKLVLSGPSILVKTAPAPVTEPSREPAKAVAEPTPENLVRIPEPTVKPGVGYGSSDGLPSIFDSTPPPGAPNTGFWASRKPMRRTTLFGSLPETPRSIYDDGEAPLVVHKPETSVKNLLEEPTSVSRPSLFSLPPRRPKSGCRSQHRVHRWKGPTLSPITEERETGPGVGALITPLTFMVETPISPFPALDTPTHRPPRRTRSPLEPSNTPRTPRTPRNPRTSMMPRTSKNSRTQRTQDIQTKANQKQKLTQPKVNRKRPRTETSPDNQNGPATPSANKRRNLGASGSTPFTRHRTPLTRRLSTAVPYSERLRRRRAESQGRIHSTIFRLPQLVAQTEADRLASENPASVPPPAEPLNPDLNLSADHDQINDQDVSEQTSAAQEPSTPEPARRGWNISGLFNSVPRSFSRFLPKFGRSPSSSVALATQEPASERIQRSQPSEVFSVAAPEDASASQSRRYSTDQPPAKRSRNLTYSLFPTPMDRSRYLGDITPKPNTLIPATSGAAPDSALTPSAQYAQPDQSLSTQPQTSNTSVNERGRESILQESNTANESQKKKRKRSASPDVIPNPVGSSYGMDLDYFCYSSESEDEEEDHPAPQTEPKKADNLARTTTRSIIQSERPASKKVRFDASPEDTPSKHRARATDPYNGRHFVGMGAPPIFSAPATPTPESRVVDPRQRPGFIPNRSGTFELDYDAFSDDSDSSGAQSPPSISTPSATTWTHSSTQPGTPPSAQLPASRSSARAAQPPSTPAKIDDEALARARSQAEKYKPKTPSGLRTTSRYSSPLTAATPDLTPAPSAKKTAEKFGDDQFAKDAQWLFENCPSGDLRQLAWPAKRPFDEGLNVSPESIRIANEIWDPSDVDKAYAVFQREFAEFKETLA